MIHSIIAIYQSAQSEEKASPSADAISIQVAAYVNFWVYVNFQVGYVYKSADFTDYCVLTFSRKLTVIILAELLPNDFQI